MFTWPLYKFTSHKEKCPKCGTGELILMTLPSGQISKTCSNPNCNHSVILSTLLNLTGELPTIEPPITTPTTFVGIKVVIPGSKEISNQNSIMKYEAIQDSSINNIKTTKIK